jgi:hypothetical protein
MDGEAVHAGVTNQDLSSQVAALGRQYETLAKINTDQSTQLTVLQTKFEDIPSKMDKMLDMQQEFARTGQAQIEHSRLIGVLFDSQKEQALTLGLHRSKFSRIAGGLAVLTFLLGVGAWAGQQAMQMLFQELSSVHADINVLKDDVNLLKFRADEPAYAHVIPPAKEREK